MLSAIAADGAGCKGLPSFLSHGDQIFANAVSHLLVESPHCVLREMRGLAVGLGRGGVAVLLVNEHRVAIPIEVVGNIGDAAGFLARSESEGAQSFGDLGAVIR